MSTVARLAASSMTIAAIASTYATMSSAQTIIARAPTGVTPEAEQSLAAAAEPRRLNLLSGDTLMSVARRLCGRLTPTYTRLLLKANESKTVPIGTAVIPACFIARLNQTVKVRPGETWTGLANRSVGIAGRKTLGDIYASNESAPTHSEQIVSSASFPIPGDVDVVKIPLTTEAVAYKVREGVDAVALATDLQQKLPGWPYVNINAGQADEFRLSGSVDPDLVRKEVCPASPASQASSWPFSMQDVTAVLERNKTHLAALGATPAASVVAVVDNGIDGIFTAAFPESDFDVSILEKAKPADGLDQDSSGYADDIVGTNVYQGGQPVAFHAAPMPAHGSAMASLVLGGRAYRLWSSQNPEAPKLKVRAVSIVRYSVEVGTMGNVNKYSMPTEALGKAVNYAAVRAATIFNLSVSTDNQLSAIEDALYNRSNLLLVVAAGNDASNFEFDTRYPASLSSLDNAYRGRVITVAAHGRGGCLSGFSARGPNHVDLAAPGEGIVATGLGGTESTDEGTSQAAALVSFAAAQLRWAGLDQSRAIKERLLASVDLASQFSGQVRSEGALNIPKALSIFEDVVELANAPGPPVYGTLQAAITPGSVCPALAGDARSVLKVSRRVDGGDPSKIRLLLRANDNRGTLKVEYCEPAAGQLLLQKVDGTPTIFSWADVVDLVPRM